MTTQGGRAEREDLAALATEAGGTGEPIIVCEGVEKWFGRFQALRGIDLSVGGQEVVVVIGPEMDDLAKAVAPHAAVIQHDRRGTGHAVREAEGEIAGPTETMSQLLGQVLGLLLEHDRLRQRIAVGAAEQHVTEGIAPDEGDGERRGGR